VHWGENGLFRIRRGTNECEIEDEVAAGVPLLDEGQGCEEAEQEAKGWGKREFDRIDGRMPVDVY